MLYHYLIVLIEVSNYVTVMSKEQINARVIIA